MLDEGRKLLKGVSLALRPGLISLLPGRRAAILEEHQRAQQMESTIKTLRKQAFRAAELGSKDLMALYNLGLYICLFERDQGMLKLDWFQVGISDRVRRSFIARQWIVLLWDVAEKLRAQGFTKQIRNSVSAIVPAEMPRVNTINSAANRFWSAHGEDLKGWRNVAGAHRDFNALHQLEIMERVDLETILPIAAAFAEVTRPTVSLLSDVLLGIGPKEYIALLERARNGGT